MRYVGKDDTNVYLRCGHCKKVHTYTTWPGTKDQMERVCGNCGKPFRVIFFRPVNFCFETLKPWLPPLIMVLLSAVFLWALNSKLLLHMYQFNLIITNSNSLLSSIVITMIGAVVSASPFRDPSNAHKSGFSKMMPTLLLVVEAVLLIFVINTMLTLNYSALSINDPNTNESQQYFGTTVNECASGNGRLFDRQGNLVYFGGFNDNKYDGYGVKYELVNDSSNVDATSYQLVYEGYFKNGQFDGQGREYRYDAKYIFAKDADEDPNLFYEGEFSNGKYCGSGILYGVEETYKGGFFDGKYNGYGTRWKLISSKIYSFIGFFHDGKMNGSGAKFYPSGQKYYEGEYIDDYSVMGTFYYENGAIMYEGELQNDNYCGTGKLYWENGTVKYDGEWSDGNRHGTGTSYREDGTKEYEGGWGSNAYSGYGEAYFEDGVTIYYGGRWKSGQKSGTGTEYYKNGKKRYDGSWQNGNLNGKAQWYWENGELFYEGDFVDGVMSGYGSTYTEKNVLNYTGDFANGLRNGKGTSYWPDGVTKSYSGEWADGVYSGQGTEYNEAGEILNEGAFENGVFIG